MAEINSSVVKVEDLRITKLRTYLLSVIDTMLTDTKYQINANMLSSDINNYSLDKIPTASVIEEWVMGISLNKDVYSFRSRMAYSQDTIDNLLNIGFFETFEQIIKAKNEARNLPDIDGIQAIRCLNCGTLRNANTNTAEFNIQIQVEYIGDSEDIPIPSI